MRAYRSERTGSGIMDAGFWNLRFESDVVSDSDKSLELDEKAKERFESDVVFDSDKSGNLSHTFQHWFESDVVSDRDKSVRRRNLGEPRFESDAVSDRDKPKRRERPHTQSLRVVQFRGVMTGTYCFLRASFFRKGAFFVRGKRGFPEMVAHFLSFSPAVPAFPGGFGSCFVRFLLAFSLQKVGFSGRG